MDDESLLVDAALAGDTDAFERLLRPHRRCILNLAYRMTGNIEDAKDVAQEAVIKVFRYLGSYRKGRNFRSWVCKTVVNAARDFLGRRERQVRTVELIDVAAEVPTPEDGLLGMEIRDRIEDCLTSLTPRERAVFVLRDGEQMSIREAARILGVSSASIRTHLSRARRKICARYGNPSGGGEL